MSVQTQVQAQVQPQKLGAHTDKTESLLQKVPLQELNRVEKRLVQMEQMVLWSKDKDNIFFTNKKGRLDSRTAGAFLQKGLPYLEKGLNTILKDQNHRSRLTRLQRLEALYEICRKGVRFEEVTADMVAEKQAFIQTSIHSYQPSW